MRHAMRHARLLGALGHNVADRHQFELGDLGDGLEMILADAAAAHEGKTDTTGGRDDGFAHCCSSIGVTTSPRRR